MERYSTTVTNSNTEKSPDAIVKVAYAHFVREPLRTYARDEVQRPNGLLVKEELIPIGQAVRAGARVGGENGFTRRHGEAETSRR